MHPSRSNSSSRSPDPHISQVARSQSGGPITCPTPPSGRHSQNRWHRKPHGGTMTDNDHLLAFALKWRHWGGGSAGDILVEFGLTPTMYFQRLRHYLHSGSAPSLPEHV